MSRQLHHLHDVVVRGTAAEHDARLLQRVAVIIVHFKAVAVALIDEMLAVDLLRHGAGQDLAGISAQAHGAAQLLHFLLLRHQVNDMVGALGIQLRGVGVRKTQHIAAVFHHCHLHAEADAEKRHLVLPAVADGLDLALNASLAEAARHQYRVGGAEGFLHVLRGQLFRVDPVDVHLHLIADAAVAERLRNAEVGIPQVDVFAHHGNADRFLGVEGGIHHGNPSGKIRSCGIQAEMLADDLVQLFVMERQRHCVQGRQVQVLHHVFLRHVAEEGDLLFVVLGDLLGCPQHDDVRLDPDGEQLLDAVLGRLGLVLAGSLQPRHQRDMDKQAVGSAHLRRKLADGLQERLALDVAHGATDLHDGDVHVVLIDVLFDLVGDVGDHLHRAAVVQAVALVLEHGPVNAAGSHVAVLRKVLVDEPLVVAQIQIGLGAVFRDEYLAVLNGIHSARVYVEIRVELLHGDLESPGLEQTSQRRGGDAFAQTGDHAAGDKNIFCRHKLSLLISDCKIHKKNL